MTIDEIRALPAGREMDALVAELVMGWQRRTGAVFSNESAWQAPGETGWAWVPEYSESIAAAWQVVEKLGSHVGLLVEPAEMVGRAGRDFQIERHRKGRTRCTIICHRPVTLWAETTALAICQAALIAALSRQQPGPNSLPSPVPANSADITGDSYTVYDTEG